MHRFWIMGATLATILALAACDEAGQQQAKDQGEAAMDKAEAAAGKAMDEAANAADKMDDMADQAMAADTGEGSGKDSATAKLEAVGDSGVTGEVTFTGVGDGLQVFGEASGMDAGKHAFHVHAKGDCGDNAKAAGGHLKFSTDSDDEIHGNLGEFTVASTGADNELTVLNVPLSEVTGKAVVVHAKGNDASQPPGGAAGDRIACGVIK